MQNPASGKEDPLELIQAGDEQPGDEQPGEWQMWEKVPGRQ